MKKISKNVSASVPIKSLNRSKNWSTHRDANQGVNYDALSSKNNLTLPEAIRVMSQDNLTADFPQNDKYLQIIEASRWLKREIQKLEKWLDGKEIVFEKSLHEQKNQQIAQDEEMVNYKFDSFKNLLLWYNKWLSKIKEQLQPFCQIRSSFIDRILYSYEWLLESIKSYHWNEMNKYILKISMLQTKNQQFEKLFEEIKKRDENRNKFTDVYEMKKKLDIMENEIGISKLFIDDKHNSIEKLLHKDGVGSDTENETKVLISLIS